MGQGPVPPSHAESRARMEGFLGVSSWFPGLPKSFPICVQETGALKIGNIFHGPLNSFGLPGFLPMPRLPHVSTRGNRGFPGGFLSVSFPLSGDASGATMRAG